MILTWTTLRARVPSPHCPWTPRDALFTQAGHAGDGRAGMPSFDGTWWTVLATWPDPEAARAAAPADVDADVWHVVLQAASFRGDAVLSGGRQPFAGLPTAGRTEGASAVITLAGLGPDPEQSGRFFQRFLELGADVASAPGHRAALVHAPEDGAVLTFSAWDRLRDAVTWAYHRPEHAATVAEQEEHPLVATSGFVRCAVLASSGVLGDRPDPLAGRTGTVVARTPVPPTAVPPTPDLEHA